MKWLFGKDKGARSADGLNEIFPMLVSQKDFVRIDVQTLYSKILTDVIERTHGITEKVEPVLWDSCLKSENAQGLVSMLAEAMTDQKDLYLVYDKAIDLVKKASNEQQQQIKADYDKNNKSDVGVYVSFTKYEKALLVKLYSALSYCVAGALNKGMNLAMALQIAVNELRQGIGFTDSPIAIEQAKKIADALEQGIPVLIDKNDEIRNAIPDVTPVTNAMKWINERLSLYTGLPASYINGEQTGGLGTTGENDTKAIERGLKSYYKSIIEPVFKALFDLKLSYKSQDFRQLTQALEALKTFDLISDEYLGPVSKGKIIQSLLDLDDEDIKADKEAVEKLKKEIEAQQKNNPQPPPQQTPPQQVPQKQEGE